MQRELPNRDKWIGFVALAWLVAVIVILASIYLISELGTMRKGSYGTSPNLTIWAIGISESIFALLMAGIFTMINSIYQNSCDQTALLKSRGAEKILPSTSSAPTPQPKNSVAREGLRLKAIHKGSPFYGVLGEGFSLQSINDVPLSTLEEAEAAKKQGKNFADIISPGGFTSKITFKVKTDTLNIDVEE